MKVLSELGQAYLDDFEIKDLSENMLFLTHKNQAKALCEGIQIKGLEKEFYHGKFHYN